MIPHASGHGPEIDFPLLAFNIDPKEAALMLRTSDEALNHKRVRRTGPTYEKRGSRIFYSHASLAAYAKSKGIELHTQETMVRVEMPERNDALAALPGSHVLN